jgi:transposase
MEKMFEIAAGIDVHRDTVVVSVRSRGRPGDELQTRTFETFDDSLKEMTKWLQECAVEVVGLESTGVYWQPVVRAVQNALPKAVVWLVNPAEVKKVPGRKTDVGDSQWLSKLVMYGLVSPSFLASGDLQELRKLTRHRTKLTADKTRYKNRILKEIESSGIKLATVCSDVLGKTGRALLDAMLAGQTLDATAIGQLAQGRLRREVPQLLRAVQGTLTRSTVIVLRQLLRQLDGVAQDIAALESEIHQLMAPMAADIQRLVQIPGFDVVAAATVLAEIGPDMSVFPSAKDLASWGGLSPGSEQSAGKAKRAPTRKGNKYLRTILVQVAMAAKATKGTFWQRKFRRLARLGPKKAAVALARSLSSVVFHILRDHTPYREPDTVPPPPNRIKARVSALTAQIEALGFHITVTPPTPSQPQTSVS